MCTDVIRRVKLETTDPLDIDAFLESKDVPLGVSAKL